MLATPSPAASITPDYSFDFPRMSGHSNQLVLSDLIQRMIASIAHSIDQCRTYARRLQISATASG